MNRLARDAYRALVPAAVRLRVREQLGRSDGDDAKEHPERLAILPYVIGRCLEVGCGHRKTDSSVLGVDLVRGGNRGKAGNVYGHRSQADVAADGAVLPFADGVFDSIIARHNLEHYIDIVGVLEEWRRVLRPGGTLAVVVPDEDTYEGRTVGLDPTHYHAFTETSLRRIMELVGYRVVTSKPVVPNWSFLLVAERV